MYTDSSDTYICTDSGSLVQKSDTSVQVFLRVCVQGGPKSGSYTGCKIVGARTTLVLLLIAQNGSDDWCLLQQDFIIINVRAST